MIRECVICGDDFEAVQSTRKYCDRCQRNSKKAREYQEKRLIASKYRMGEMPSQQIVENVCQKCGKTFHSYGTRRFCSKICSDQHRFEIAQCCVCSKPLYPLGIVCKGNVGYCSEKCREQRRWERALERGDVIPCKQCKKEFIRKSFTNEFCCNECRKEYQSQNKKTLVPKVSNVVIATCEVCGAEFHKHKNNVVYTCGKACSTERKRRKMEKLREEKKKSRLTEVNSGKLQNNNSLSEAEKERQRKVKAALAGKMKEKEVRKMHLCSQCKTPQSVCEMFTSNFKYHPKGAKMRSIDGQNVVLQCPKFK